MTDQVRQIPNSIEGSSSLTTATQITTLVPKASNQQREARQRQLEMLHAEIAGCQLCVNAGYIMRAAGIAGFSGRIGDRIMLIGQAPGHLSAERGFPFAGPGGKVLASWLQQAGYPSETLHAHMYLSALTKCDPGKNVRGGGDRKPSSTELALCRPFLLRELDLIRPRAILMVGGMAIEAFLGPQHLREVIGKQYESNGVKLLPLPHPSGVSRWLNRPEHQNLLARALAILADWRREWENEATLD